MGRIENHPILGPSPEGKTVTFYYNGTPMEGLEGEPIMAALKVNGVMVHRYTAKSHEPRDRKMHRLRNDRGWETECQNLHHSFERRNEG